MPGRRSQPKTFTDTAHPPAADEQPPSNLSYDQQQSDQVEVPLVQLEEAETKPSVLQAQTNPPPRPHTRPKLIRFLPVFISLLVILVFLGTDDMGFYSDQSKNVAVAAVQAPLADPAITVAENPVLVQPMVSDSPPENTKTQAKGQLRVITHVVVKGDTLWHIAKTYLQDPFRYPELVSINKIKNPDLIYPHEIVRIHVYD